MPRQREETPRQAHIRQLFGRVVVSFSDLKEARQSLEKLRELDELDEPVFQQSHDSVAHTVCLVLAYARAFMNSRANQEVGRRLPDSVIREFTKDERTMHRRLLELRNAEFAHSDGGATDMDARIVERGGRKIGMPVSRIMRRPFVKGDLEVIAGMLTKIDFELSRLLIELPSQLPVDDMAGWGN